MNCKKIGNFIFRMRKQNNLTQKQLADKLNITDRAVSKWERGLEMPDISLIQELSEILNVSVSEILKGEKIDTITKEEADNVTIESILFYREKEKKQTFKKILLVLIIIFLFFFPLSLFSMSLIMSNISLNYVFISFFNLFLLLLFFIKLNKNEKLKKIILFVIFIIYSIILISSLFYTGFSYHINNNSNITFAGNFIPFKSIFKVFNCVFTKAQPISYLFDNIIIDLVIFMPFAIILPELTLIFKEIIQLITGFGIFDIDDIILNFIGALLMFSVMKVTI